MNKQNWQKAIIAGLALSLSMALYAAGFQSSSQVNSERQTSQSRSSLHNLMSQIDDRLANNMLDHEASLLKVLVSFNRGELQQAMQEVDDLIQRAPDFHLAYLVKGDILMSRFGPVSDIGQSPLLQQLTKQDRDKLQLLRDEAYARLRASVSQRMGDKVPLQLLALAPQVEKAVLVEKSSNRLYIYERTGDDQPPRLVRDYYVSTGKKRGNKQVRGDLKTPEGVYFVTSWIPDEKLPTKYGIGAFPVNYPNEYDRKQGKTGYGIWLHGTDDGYYSRPPLDSEGCVVLTNIDLASVKHEIKPGVTPVVITEQVTWLKPGDWQAQRKSILAALEQWRQDWESLDVERYLSHYHRDFWNASHTLNSWKARKRLVARNKTYQRVKLTNVSVLAYPKKDELDPMVVVRFRQHYDSNNYKGDINKRLYLRKQGGDWRILYEGS